MAQTKLQCIKSSAQDIDDDVLAFVDILDRILEATTLPEGVDALDEADAYLQNWVCYITRARRRLV